MRKIATRSCKKHHKHNFHWNGSSVNVLLSWYRFCNVKNICNYDIFFLLVRDLSFYLISPLSEQMNSCICSNSCSTVYHISYPSRNHAKASCLFVSYKLSATAISQMAGIGPRELSILPLFTQSVWMAECHVPIHSCVGTPPPPPFYTTEQLWSCLPSQVKSFRYESNRSFWVGAEVSEASLSISNAGFAGLSRFWLSSHHQANYCSQRHFSLAIRSHA